MPEIFHKWFHNSFVPTVHLKLSSLGLEQKAVLVWTTAQPIPMLKNWSAKMERSPPTTCHQMLSQPMDQGVLKALKCRYKKKILRRLLIEENIEFVVDFLKSVGMKVVADLIAEYWLRPPPYKSHGGRSSPAAYSNQIKKENSLVM